MQVTLFPLKTSHLKQAKMILLVPAADCLLTSVMMPKMPAAKLRAAIPFVLEEQLISELEELHVALGEPDKGQVPVIVTSKHKMRAWLEEMKARHIEADIMMPMSLALPGDEKKWLVLLTPQLAIIRRGKWETDECDPENLQLFLEQRLADSAQLPELIHLHNFAGRSIADDMGQLPVKLVEKILPIDALESSLSASAAPMINLLQGEFRQRKKHASKTSIVTRLLYGLSAGWIALLVLYPVISYMMLRQQLNFTENQIHEIYQQYFPQAKNVVAPKIRMQALLDQAKTISADDPFLNKLAIVAQAVRGGSGVELKRVDFQHGELTMGVVANDSESFTAFVDALLAKGLNVRQQNANLAESHIHATLVIGGEA